MNTPPPSDDERFDYIEENETSRSRQRRRNTSYNPDLTPAQQNRRARPQPGPAQAKRFDPNETVLETSLDHLADTPYKTEEKPSRPKVRRASLPPEAQQRRSPEASRRPATGSTRPQPQHNTPRVPNYPQRQRVQRRRPETEAPLSSNPYIDEAETANQLPPDLDPMPPLRRLKSPASDQLRRGPVQPTPSNRRPNVTRRPPINAEETIVDTPQQTPTGRMRAAQRPVPPLEEEDEFETPRSATTGRMRATRRPVPPPLETANDIDEPRPTSTGRTRSVQRQVPLEGEEEFNVVPRSSTTGRTRAIQRPIPPPIEEEEFDAPRPTPTGRMRAIQQPVARRTGARPATRSTATGRMQASPRPASEFQRRNTRLNTPPPLARHAYVRKPGLANRLQDIRHNRPLLMLIGLILLVLIIAPIITSVRHSAQSSQVQIPGTGGQISTDQTGTTVPAKPLDPHEIVITPPPGDHAAPPLHATAAYILDANTGATLYAKNPFMHLPILSTTKLMTALLAIEHGNLNQRIKITPKIWNDISQLSADGTMYRVNNGSTYTLREMLYGLLMVSGNDCAVVIADDLGGNLPNFIKMMNARAKSLGMNDTHYVNPHGLLDPGHYSSAHDLALIGRAALTNSTIKQISGTRTMTVPTNNDHPGRLMINGDQFLWWYSGVDSGKPGFDGENNHVQVISCIRNNHHLIAVVIRANNYYTDMRTLLNYGFNLYDWQSPAIVDKQHPIPFDYDDNYFSSDTRDSTISTSNGGRYYLLTGYSISGQIMSYFDKNGGLQKIGYPKSQPTPVSDSVSKQSFEHGTIQCNSKTKQCSLV